MASIGYTKLNSVANTIHNLHPKQTTMRVQKRGSRGMEELKFDKITERIKRLCGGLDKSLDPTAIAQSTIKSIFDGITTEDLDKISAKIAEAYKLVHPDYSILAAKVLVSNLHKTTPKTFSQCMKILGENLEIKSERHYAFIAENAAALDNMIINDNDYSFDYFGFKTLENAYLTKIEERIAGHDGGPVYIDRKGNNIPPAEISYTRRNKPVVRNEKGVIVCMARAKTRDRVMDRPQYVFMRVAIAIYFNDNDTVPVMLENIKQCYKALSQMYFTHATPTLFNSCCKVQQLNSCFLLGSGDSIEQIMKTLSDASFISKRAGGIGIHMHGIRCAHSDIKGTNGKSSGLPKQLKIYNEAARCWDQGGKRLGAFAIYLEPWHGDILKVLELKLQIGKDEERARDLFYALWVPDLFVKRAEADADWSLFSDSTAPGLSDVYDGMDVCVKCGHSQNVNYAKLVHLHSREDFQGVLDGIIPKTLDTTCDHLYEPRDVFTELYTRYEEEGLAMRVVRAREVLDRMCDVQRESGTPYICFKDHVNRMTNQKNIGTIQSSNLCVTPDTYILTDAGQHKIIDLVGKRVNVWNGEGFSEVVPAKTGQNQKIISVNLSNGVTIDNTEYHKYYIYRGAKIVKVEAKDLLPGDKLIKYSLPTIYDGEEFPHAYTHGLFCADGTYENTNLMEKPCDWKSITGDSYCARHITHKRGDETPSEICQGLSNIPHPRITLYGQKQQLDRYLDKRIASRVENNKTHVNLPIDIAPKFTVPANACINDKLAWFAGYCDGDGCVVRNGTNYSIQCSSVNREFLLQIRLMLQTMGVDSKVTIMHKEGIRQLPDGNGGLADYQCKTSHRLLITSNGVVRLQELGFDTNRLVIPQQTPQRDAAQFITVTSVEDNGKISDTYCFTERHRGMGMFNGVLTGNCAEIMEWSSVDSYACCTLASMNLKKHLENGQINHQKLYENTRLAAKNLDIIIDVNDYPVPECEQNSRDLRPIGIGIQGLADVFALMRIPFLSDEAAIIDIEIAETVLFAALTESNERAKLYGAYKGFWGSPASRGELPFDLWLKNQARIGGFTSVHFSGRYDWEALRQSIMRHGLRNSLHVAFMPTVSTSQILGNNESFEPYASNIYTKTTLAGKFTVSNNSMIRHLIHLGIWSVELKNKIITNNGSVQGIDEIPEHVQEIYKTVWELKQSELMKRASLRGAFIDQSQSLNIHIKDNSNSTLRGIFFTGWKLGLKTGSYYIRTPPAAQAMKNNIAETKTAPVKLASAKSKFRVVNATVTKKILHDVPNVTADDEVVTDPSLLKECTACSS